METVILYSFRRCPYCMRAHMALKQSGLQVELREVKLSDMPEQALSLSPQATVPILLLPDGTVFTESWDIVKWAVEQNDPQQWLGKEKEHALDTEILIETNDFSFKEDLDRYKYADRFPEHPQSHYLEACEKFILELEHMLSENGYLLANKISLADIAVFPFVRQFSLVDKDWFETSPYPKVRNWLQELINTALFQDIFQKHELWQQDAAKVYI